MSDKKLGYVLMALILLLAGGFVFAYWWVEHAPYETRVLRFPEVGSLAVEDPVRMSGMVVATVYGFEHDSLGRVLVYVSSRKDFSTPPKKGSAAGIPIRTSSGVAVKVKGVMGERFIDITPGNLEDPLVPKDQIIDGKFEMGPSEAIVYIDLLVEKIIEYKELMQWINTGKDGERSFVQAFGDVVDVIDTLTETLLTGMAGLETGLEIGLDTAARLIEKTGEIVDKTAKAVPEALESINSVLVKIDNLVPKLEKVIATVDATVEKIDGNKFLWGDDVEKVQKRLIEIKKFVDNFRENGLPLTVKLKYF